MPKQTTFNTELSDVSDWSLEDMINYDMTDNYSKNVAASFWQLELFLKPILN